MKEGKDKFCGMTQTFVSVAAGGWIAVVVILLICIIGLVVGSVFGILLQIRIMKTVSRLFRRYAKQMRHTRHRLRR